MEAATLPIRGQEEKSAFGAMNGWCDAMPYVAGNYGDRYSVRSRFRRSQSSCSTHMYNCRRARFGAPAWAILQHPPVVTSPLLRGGLLVVLSPSIRTRLRRSSLLYRHRLPSRWPSPRLTVSYRRQRGFRGFHTSNMHSGLYRHGCLDANLHPRSRQLRRSGTYQAQG